MSIGFCVRHPDRPASARCHSCHKPVCADCVVQEGSNTFCSKTCRDNYVRFHGRYTPEGKPGCLSKLKNLVVGVLALAVFGGLAVYAGAKLLHVSLCIELLKRVGL